MLKVLELILFLFIVKDNFVAHAGDNESARIEDVIHNNTFAKNS